MKKIQISILATAVLLSGAMAYAGEGHGHGEAAPAAAGNGPKRLPDGNVFLPKTSQRQLAVRTVLTEAKELPQTVELSGKVIMDANAGGRVQATQPGRIEPGSRGLPQLGQVVRKGDVLALVRSSAGAIERANQQSQNAELSAQLELARRRAARYAQLDGTVPQKDIEAAQADVQSLQARVTAVARSVSATESLVAPVSGVVSLSNAIAGQVVDAREVLFEIVDPARLVIEALAFDLSLLNNISGASASTGATTGAAAVPLQFMGAGRSQREGAIPLQFRTDGKQAVPFAINQPVKVLVQTRAMVKGVPVPSGAIVKSASNQDMVWVHTGAESFTARPVRFTPLDGANASVVDGLKAGERVVTQGAALVNQVR